MFTQGEFQSTGSWKLFRNTLNTANLMAAESSIKCEGLKGGALFTLTRGDTDDLIFMWVMSRALRWRLKYLRVEGIKLVRNGSSHVSLNISWRSELSFCVGESRKLGSSAFGLCCGYYMLWLLKIGHEWTSFGLTFSVLLNGCHVGCPAPFLAMSHGGFVVNVGSNWPGGSIFRIV